MDDNYDGTCCIYGWLSGWEVHVEIRVKAQRMSSINSSEDHLKIIVMGKLSWADT